MGKVFDSLFYPKFSFSASFEVLVYVEPVDRPLECSTASSLPFFLARAVILLSTRFPPSSHGDSFLCPWLLWEFGISRSQDGGSSLQLTGLFFAVDIAPHASTSRPLSGRALN